MKKYIDLVTEAIEEKKGMQISTIEFEDKGFIADFFVIATGNNDRQTKAIADFVEEEMEKAGEKVVRREGYREGHWIILDYGFLLVHIFTPTEREFYDIERLWQESVEKLGANKDDL